jgi:hypothetical protein
MSYMQEAGALSLYQPDFNSQPMFSSDAPAAASISRHACNLHTGIRHAPSVTLFFPQPKLPSWDGQHLQSSSAASLPKGVPSQACGEGATPGLRRRQYHEATNSFHSIFIDPVWCCMQMCAPYNALQNYKLKVKVTPGSQRKGRAARQVRCSTSNEGSCRASAAQ